VYGVEHAGKFGEYTIPGGVRDPAPVPVDEFIDQGSMSGQCRHCRFFIAVHQASTSADKIAAKCLSTGGASIAGLLESWLGLEAVRGHAIIVIGFVTIGAVRPVRHTTCVIAWRSLEPTLIDIDDIAVLANIVFEHSPWQRMIALADAEESPEGHHRIGGLPRYLVDHHAVDRTKMLALQIIDGGADHHVGRDQAIGFTDSDFRPTADVCVCIIILSLFASLSSV